MDKEEIKNSFDQKSTNLKAFLKRTRQASRQVEKGEWIFRVILRSMWEGETKITYDGQYGESLEDVISGAEEEFKKINNRSDVQAFRLVNAVAKNGEGIPVE